MSAVPPDTRSHTDTATGTGSGPLPDAPAPPSSAGSLAAVPRLLRSDPALGVLIGAADGTVAVPEAAHERRAEAVAI